MSKLTDYYAHKAALNEQNDPRWEQIEDQLLKEELLPEIIDHLKTVLSKVKSPLVLNINYSPSGELSVMFTRNCIFSSAGKCESVDSIVMPQPTPEDSSTETELSPDPDPQAEHREGGEHKKPVEDRADKTVLRVTFPDGTVIADKKAKVTFAESIKRIGLMRVRSLGLTFCHVPLVSNTLDKKYANQQTPVGSGLYVMTHSSTQDKKKQLEKISDQLHLGLKVEII